MNSTLPEFDLRTLHEPVLGAEALRAAYVAQQGTIEALVSENTALKVKIARLEKNSSTSSKPPSSDIVKPKAEQRQPGLRKRGGQPGHPGVKRVLPPSESMDAWRDLPLKACPDCQHPVSVDPQAPVRVQQQFELRESPVFATEFTRPGHFCPHCRRTVYAPLPEGVRPDEVCGPRLESLIAWLKADLGASYTKIEAFTRGILGVTLARSTLCAVVRRASEGLRESVETLERAVPTQASLHVDETGWKTAGQRRWVWVFCNPALCFMTVASRGAVELRSVLGDSFAGALHSDFYGPYTAYPSDTKQFCLAHLIRDVKFLTTLPPGPTRDWGTRILAPFRPLFRAWNARDDAPPEASRSAMEAARSALKRELDEDPPPRGFGLNLYDRMHKHWESLFRFIDDPALYSPTNNAAERQLRPLILLRSATQGSRSDWGEAWIGHSQTVLQTCRLQHRSAWTFFCDAITAHRLGRPAPSLLPTVDPP